ncbi:MAG TPA: rhomboid family intramembrane serine protease [Caulobacteraceae bacterium]|nr:rhomboid family intramembrane serine protease [Caulobacteraceae bacterium]
MSDPEIPQDAAPREPIFNAPWPAMTVALAIVGSFVLQGRLGERFWSQYVLTPAEVMQLGRYETLLTPLLLHGNWVHTLMNAVAALAFGAPVARLLGLRLGGALVFLLFYLACGALSSLGYVLAHADSLASVVGASGAVSGLMGGASRLIERPGTLGRLVSPTTVGMAAAWVVVNLIIGYVPVMPGAEGAGIAWEAHVAGYFAGLLLIAPFARLSSANH